MRNYHSVLLPFVPEVSTSLVYHKGFNRENDCLGFHEYVPLRVLNYCVDSCTYLK